MKRPASSSAPRKKLITGMPIVNWRCVLMIYSFIALPLRAQEMVPGGALQNFSLPEDFYVSGALAISESSFPSGVAYLARINTYLHYRISEHWDLSIGQEYSIGGYSGLFLGFMPLFRNQEVNYFLRPQYRFNPEAKQRHSLSLGLGLGFAQNLGSETEPEADLGWAPLISPRYTVNFWPQSKNYPSLFVQFDFAPDPAATRSGSWALGLVISLQKRQRGSAEGLSDAVKD